MTFFNFFKRYKKPSSQSELFEKKDSSLETPYIPPTNDEIKNSIFLPKTDFPMKANLPTKEPSILAQWEKNGIYKRLREKSKNLPRFILHYGPPYANGAIHMGHAFTEGIKDIITKTYQMAGYDAPLVPGWDCHGLPIEWKVEENFRKNKKHKEDVSVIEFLSHCRNFATHWIELQQTGLKRLGICADWDHPYKTMDSSSEGAIVSQFLKIFMDGYIYRGKKPVLWSTVEKTALAEAEVEYKNHTSTAIYVTFPIVDSPIPQLMDSFIVIWTTTPWTLPANRAIAYHDNILYVLLEVINIKDSAEKSLHRHQKLLIAADLAKKFCETAGITNYSILSEFKGCTLKGVICQHPFDLSSNQTEKEKMSPFAYTFIVPLVSAKHVTTEVGTGFVHTAPSHGMEDFIVGKEYKLPMPDIVQADGTYISNLPLLGNKHIFKVADEICDLLRQCQSLIFAEKIEHSYPHSWRSKSPLIFRLTSQWFLEIDKLRSQALNSIDHVNWIPAQSKNRIRGMVETRPDWCLSRQRVWGTPLTLFLHKETKEPLKDETVNAKIIETITNEGIEAWHQYDADFFLSQDQKGLYDKVTDTLDVWFDSACTHYFVLQQREDLKWPADVYLEGSDQHRGWFQSSLIESIATKGTAPYKTVVTHGFILDQEDRKMSKSQGNVISCEDIINRYGADLLRLWIVSVDYTEDIKIGTEILKRQEDIYRRFRNTLRYLLGSLNGFSEQDNVLYEDMPELEKYLLHKIFILDEKHKICIKTFNLVEFYNDLHVFCTNELSAFYFDIRKDSLYCDAKSDLKRLATQTVMNILFQHIVHWLAPVLSFTAEEAWQHYQSQTNESIHERTFPNAKTLWNRPDIDEKWQKIRSIRRVITNAIEQERLAKTIVSNLQSNVVLFATKEIASLLKNVDMSEIVIISHFTLLIAQPQAGAVTLDDVPGVGVVVTNASGTKCPRCWKIFEKVYESGLCSRCLNVIKN